MPGAWLAARCLTAACNAVMDCMPGALQSIEAAAIPSPVRWQWPSMNPGNSERPRSSTTRAPGPASARISASPPAARMRPPPTASAGTISLVALTVWTRPPTKIRSAWSFMVG